MGEVSPGGTAVIRKIVIPVRGDGKGDNVFAHACAVAKRYGSHVVVTHCRARAEDMMPYGVPIPESMKRLILSQSGTVADQVEAGLRDEAIALAERFGVVMGEGRVEGKASASWAEQQGRQVDVIKRHGRLADLICVAKPDVSRNLGTNTLKAALFHTGRPVMMCPPAETPPSILGARLAIAWNGSAEASRAVALTLPLIEGADEVVVLSGGRGVDGADAEDLSDYLGARGVEVTVETFNTKKRIGEELLARSEAHGVDTLIMGAYSQSHERETVFGGNTQHIVDRSTMPVVMVH